MRGSILLLFLILTVAPAARAQTAVVYGTVEDELGHPVPGAHVVLENTTVGAVAAMDGTYTIESVPPGPQTLVASAVGFRRTTRSVVAEPGARLGVDFVLEEILLESGEVVVTALRRPEVTALVPVSVSVVTNEDLQDRNVLALDDALRYTPGVQMAENQVNIRGSSGFSYNVGSRVLLLVDGVPMLGPETGGVPFDALPLPQVARIEVVKGPGSALYGSGALGGVINVITRDFPEQPETSLRLFGGLHDPVRHAQWREGWPEGGDQYRPVGGLSLTHARRVGVDAGGWLHVSYRRDRGYMQYNEDHALQAYAKLGWDPSSALSLRMLGGITARERDAFFYWNGIMDPLSPGNLDLLAPGSSDATGTNDNRTVQLSVLPTLRHVVSPRLFHSLRLRYFLVQIRPIDEQGNPRPIEDGTSGFRFGGEWQVDWSIDDAKYLTAGISADANAARSEFFRSAGGDYVFAQPELGAFAQYEQALGSRVNTLVGLRYDAYQIDSTTTASRLSPKLSAAYSVTDDLVLRASYGRGFRVPGIAERYIDNQSFFPFFPNYRLRPETSTGYEIGLHTETAMRFGVLVSDAAFFWNDYSDLVEPKFVTDPTSVGTSRLGFQFVNLTSARIRGAEVTTEALLRRDVTLSLAYTYLDAKDRLEDRALAFRSKHLLKISGAVPLLSRIEFGLDYRAASRPERVDTDFARFVADADLMVPVHVLDLRLAYGWPGVEMTLLIKNALDYYYVERPAYLAPPRQLILQLRADL